MVPDRGSRHLLKAFASVIIGPLLGAFAVGVAE